MANPFLDPPGRAYDWAEGNPIGTSSTTVVRSADGQPFDPLVGVGYGRMLQSQVDRAKANAEVVGGGVGSLGGLGSKLANQRPRNLDHAIKMESRMELPRTILQKTGWWKNPQGEWKFEIPDDNMLLKVWEKPQDKGFIASPDFREISGADLAGQRLSDVIDHPELFKHYPALRDVKVGNDMTGGGAANWDYMKHQINLQPEWMPTDQMRRLLGHEITHATQSLEGWQNGSAPSAHLPKEYRDVVKQAAKARELFGKLAREKGVGPKDEQELISIAKAVADGALSPKDPYFMQFSKFMAEFPDIAKPLLEAGQHLSRSQRMNSDAFKAYKSVTGEADARAVERRLDLTSAQRRMKPFWEDYDVSPRYQIPAQRLPWVGDLP